MSKTFVYIRPALVTGGVLFADLEILLLLNQLGYDVHIVTGKVLDTGVSRHIYENGYHLIEDAEFDQLYLHAAENVSESKPITDRLRKLIPKESVLLFSNQLVGEHKAYAKATIELSREYKTMYRLHDPITLTDIVRDAPLENVTFLPINSALATQVYSLCGESVRCHEIPFFLAFNRYTYALKRRKIVRKLFGYTEHSIVLFQPTRIAPNKRCDRALLLASKLQQFFGEEKIVSLVISGGSENIQGGYEETRKIMHLSKELGFHNLYIKRGLHYFVENPMFYAIADLVTFMSDYEGMGVVPAEASVAYTPLVTTNYKNLLGDPVFESAYPGLQAIMVPDAVETVIPDAVVEACAEELLHPKINHKKNLSIVEYFDSKSYIPFFSDLSRQFS